MSKTKRMVDENQRDLPIDHQKLLDDEYQEQYFYDIVRSTGNKPPPVSDCCESQILYFKGVEDKFICSNCKGPCETK